MADTANLGLPLVASAQTQKHITVNESLLLIDGLMQGRISGVDTLTPPVADNGTLWAIGTGATDDWSGQDGNLALATEGGWRFITPKLGWRLADAATGKMLSFDGTDWIVEGQNVSSQGASIALRVSSFDHLITAGSISTTGETIPSHAHVIGVTARVINEITTDTGTSWRLGVSNSDDRYGTGLGLTAGSFAKGLTGSGVTYYSDTALELTCEGGAFTGGKVRIAIHYIDLTPPA